MDSHVAEQMGFNKDSIFHGPAPGIAYYATGLEDQWAGRQHNLIKTRKGQKP